MGIKPKKLMPTTADTRPRKWAGACSCTMVLARPKFIESAIAMAPMAHAVSKKLCDQDMRKTPKAMAATFPPMNFKRFSRATLNKPIEPTNAELPDSDMNAHSVTAQWL